MPRTWRAADDGGEADDRAPWSPRAPRGPGHAEDRADGDDRVGRRQDHQVGVGDGVEHAGRRVGLVEADRRPRPRRAPRRAAAPSTPGSARPGGRSALGSATRRGSRPGRRSSAAAATPRLPALAQRLGDGGERIARRRASGCAPGGWRCRGRRGRTRSAPRRTPPAPPWRSRSRRGGPSPRSWSMPSPSVYITVSRSGQTFRPWIQQVVGGVGDDGDLGVARRRRAAGRWRAVPQPLQELGAAHPSGEHGEPGALGCHARTLPGRGRTRAG